MVETALKQTHEGIKQVEPHTSKNKQNQVKNKPLDPMGLEDIVRLANKVGMAYVSAKKTSDRLELLKASRKAQAMEKYDNGEHSETKIKRLAEVDSDYILFLEEYAEAKAACEQLKIRYESYKNLFEARRSMLSYQKAEMKIL